MLLCQLYKEPPQLFPNPRRSCSFFAFPKKELPSPCSPKRILHCPSPSPRRSYFPAPYPRSTCQSSFPHMVPHMLCLQIKDPQLLCRPLPPSLRRTCHHSTSLEGATITASSSEGANANPCLPYQKGIAVPPHPPHEKEPSMLHFPEEAAIDVLSFPRRSCDCSTHT